MQRRSALIAALVSAACFGTLAIFATLAYRAGAEPLPLLAWRFAVAAVALGAYVSLTRRGGLRISRSDALRYAGIALFGYGAASVCFFNALNYADASIVAVLLYTYPAMVILAERVFIGTRLTPTRTAGVGLTFLGCALVLGLFSGGGVAPLGILLGLGAAAGYTVFTMLSHRWLPGRSRLVMMTFMLGFSAVFVALVAVASGVDLSPAAWEVKVWLYVGALVAIPTLTAIVLYLRAMRSLGPGQASIVSTVEPVFTVFLAALFLGDRLGVIELLGVLLVIAGVVVAESGARKPSEIPAV